MSNVCYRGISIGRLLFLALGILSLQTFAERTAPFKVLALYTPYDQMGDAAHAAYALEANTWFPKVAAANGFIYEASTDWGKLNAATLANYKVVMFLDNMPWDGSQRNAFKSYMENGGGFVGFHVSAFNQNPADWDWYFNQFLGMGSYVNNTWAPTTAILDDEDTSFFVTKGFPKKFTAPVNEWYGWSVDLRTKANIKILCSIDPASYPLGTGTGAGGASEIWHSGYHPIIWTNKNYRMVYSNIGHDDVNYSTRVGLTKTFDTVHYAKLVLNAINYCAGMTTAVQNRDAVLKKAAPNPEFFVRCAGAVMTVSAAKASSFAVTLADLDGRIVRKGRGDAGICQLSIEGLAPGVYIARLRSSAGDAVRSVSVGY
jgi:uncharacterized protein